MKYERNKNKIFASIGVFFVVVFAFVALAFSFPHKKVNADTNYLVDLSPYVINDWENYTDSTQAGLSIVANADGTLIVNGTATAITEYVIPTKIKTLEAGVYYDWYAAVLYNNTFDYGAPNARMYLAYNNGANITANNTYIGRNGNGVDAPSNKLNNVCLIIRFNANTTYNNAVLTPFFMLALRPNDFQANLSQQITISTINTLIGPSGPAIPEDLTRCVYVAPEDIPAPAIPINQRITYTFNNSLENLIEYTFTTGFEPNVDTTGLTALYVDLLTFEDASENQYIMRYNNDAESAQYLNIDLYINNDATPFYNSNAGELTAQNELNFRVWAVNAINNEATITGATAYSNNIIEKIFVYAVGSASYEAGYQTGLEKGLAEGAESGFAEGLRRGYTDGYADGTADGYNEGLSAQIDTTWLTGLFNSVDAFLNIRIFPNITFGVLLGIPFVISVAWFIIRMFRGGGGD